MYEKHNNSFLVTDDLQTLMLKYSLPCIISLLVGALYNIVDQIFIANADYLGSFGNAANTVVFPLTVIALAISTMIGDGCCAYVSINLGAKEHTKADRSVGSAIVFTVIVSLVITALYLIFLNPILTMFGAKVNEQTFKLSKEYFFWIAIGMPFYMIGQALNPIIRSDGSPRVAMATLIVGAILNCILDPIFIFACKWGMAGAAIATVIGQVVSAILAIIYLFHLKTIKLNKDCFRPRLSLISKMLLLGITSFLSQISIVFSMAAVLNMVKKYSAYDQIFGQPQYAQIPTAVIGIVMKFYQIVISISVGLSAGCIPIIGYNIGAGRKDRAKLLLKILLAAETIVGLIALIIFEAFPYQLTSIFGAANESVYYTQFSVKCIRLFLCSIILSCINKGTFIYLQALGKALESTALSLLREIVFGVGLVLILPIFFGLDGILYFMAVADVLTFIVSVVIIVKTNKELDCPGVTMN